MIFLTGDTHSAVFERIVKLRKQFKEVVESEENVYLIVLGDCGLVWDADYMKTANYIEKYISNHIPNLKILSMLGNHENYNLIYDLPKINMFGNDLFKVSENIYFFENGREYLIEKHKFVTFGGALSIDKHLRKEFKTWWSQEIPSYKDMQDFVTLLDTINTEEYILLTHTTSDLEITYFDKFPFTDKLSDPVANYLKFIKQNYKFFWHYFGHFHLNIEREEIQSTCLYKEIIQL